MRILYLSQYFPPESGATQTRSFEMARYLVQQGHQVTVIANIPNHPSGVIHPGFHGRLFERQMLEGIDVIYVRAITFVRKSFATRMLFYFSYVVSATLAALILCRDIYDLIYATSPPLPVGFSALTLHRLQKTPFFFEVRDLWPSSAVQLGLIRNRSIIKLASWLEKTCYGSAQRIIVVTDGIKDTLKERGINFEKISLIPNGTNAEELERRGTEGKKLRKFLDLGDKIVILYAGILGVAQGLETMLHAAKILAGESRFQFIVVGEGPMSRKLRHMSRDMALSNLLFLGEHTRKKMPQIYSAADAALIPLKRGEVLKHAIPTKMFDAWACETPVILGVEGEAKGLLRKTGGGIPYLPEDPEDLVRAIRNLDRLGEAGRREMGEKARRYVKVHHSRARYAGKLEMILANSLSELKKEQRH